MGLIHRLFGSRKKMLQDSSKGIDMVKLGLMCYLLPECEANFGEEYAQPLTAAVVNCVFSEPPSNEIGEQFIQLQENQANISLVIEKDISPQENLRQIITDAVRVKCILAHAMNPKMLESDFIRLCRKPLENLKQLVLLVPGGDEPDLTGFLHNAGNFFSGCKADLEYRRSK